jgi:pyridinium-3,5-biscarboxylic acid mononucleotide sulfurtransferase
MGITVSHPISQRIGLLHDDLARLGRAVIAFSGGVDSSLLLKVASDALQANALGVIAVSPSLSKSERDQAVQLAAELGASLQIIETKETEDASYQANAANRCFFCKDHVYAALSRFAMEQGIEHVLDGMNVDDTVDIRPGRAAALKHGVRSPLEKHGFTKQDVREAAKALGLRNWDKPAAACLASRIPYGTRVTTDLLARIESAEAYVKSLGFAELRVRHHGDVARIEVPTHALASALDKQHELCGGLKALGWTYVTLDLDGLRQGSMNEVLKRPAAT